MAKERGPMTIFYALIFVWLLMASVMITNSVVYNQEVSEKQISTLAIVGSPSLMVIASLVKEREKRTEIELSMAHQAQEHSHVMARGGIGDEEQ